MALISNPRTFEIPCFHFDRSGTFVREKKMPTRLPSEAFSCKIIEGAFHEGYQLPKRDESKIWTIDADGAELLYLSSVDKEIPLFFRAEILTVEGNCQEPVYDEFWKRRIREDLTYLSFNTHDSRKVTAEGRILELVLFLALFEAESTLTKTVVDSLENQRIQSLVSENWNELRVPVRLELNARVSFVKQISLGHPVVTKLIEALNSGNQ